MELLQAIDVGSMSLLVAEKLTLRMEVFQMLDSISAVIKEMSKHLVYKSSKSGWLEFLTPIVGSALQLCLRFDERRDGKRHDILCTIVLNFVKSYRNFIYVQTASESSFDEQLVLQMLTILVKLYSVKELVINALRILLKLSSFDSFLDFMSENKKYLDDLLMILGKYKEENFIAMETAYILANLTALKEDIGAYVYFNDNGVIFATFEHYINKTSNQDDYYETMIKSFANFDFLNQNDKNVLNKVIRLLANIFTVEEPSLHFIKERFPAYKQLLKKLRFFMTENEVVNNSELLVCVLSCISNILYYDKPNLTQNDFEIANLKQDMTSAVAFIILQPKDDEILIEGLRVISNLSRTKNGIKNLLKIKFEEAISVLLNHRSRDIVFYSIGILINLSNDKVDHNNKGIQRVQDLQRYLQDAS